MAPHGIDGDGAALHIEQVQEMGNGGDFVGLAIDPSLAEQHLHVGRPGADHGERLARARCLGAAQRLAINGYHALHAPAGSAQPRKAGALQGLGVQAPEHPRKGVVRGDARGQAQEARKPVAVGLAELGHLHPVVCAADGGAQGDGEQIDEVVSARALHAGVGDALEVLEQAHGRKGGARIKGHSVCDTWPFI